MKIIQRIFTKSHGAKPNRKATLESSAPPLVSFESLEGRRMMSASTVSAVSFEQPKYETIRIGSVLVRRVVGYYPATAVFSIAADGSVSESTGPGNLTKLGGTFTQISAGLDVKRYPEVYGIAPNGTIAVNDGAGWLNLGRYATQISASIDGTVYFTGADRSTWMHSASGFTPLYGQVTQISAGVDFAGQPEVYAVGYPSQSAFVNFGQGWVGLGGQVQQVAGAMDDTVYVIGIGNAVYVNHHTTIGGTGWQSLGGVVSQISAGLNASGNDEVFAIGSPSTHAFVNGGNGWTDFYKSAIEIAAPAMGIGVGGSSVAVVDQYGQTEVHDAAGFYSIPGTLDAIQYKYQSLGGPTGPLGLPVDTERAAAGTNGRFQDFQHGSIYWSPIVGVHLVQGYTLLRYQSLKGPGGSFGFPTGDTEVYPNGNITYFQHGKMIEMNGKVTVVPFTTSMTFNNVSGYLTTNQAVGGVTSLTVRQDGSYSFSYDFNDSSKGGFFSYNYIVSILLVSPSGNVFTFTHTYDIGKHGDASTLTGVDTRLADNWQDLQGAQATAIAAAQLDWVGYPNQATQAANDLKIVGTVVEVFAAIVGALI